MSTNSLSSDLAPVSVFREDYISATSFKSTDRNAVLAGDYELAVFAVSWDRRCLSLPKGTAWRAKRAVLIRPPVIDKEGYCACHEEELVVMLNERCQALELIDGAKLGFDGVWDRLYEIGVEEATRAPSPGAFLLDLSAMSRFYSAGLVAMIIRLGIAARTDCFYAEGRYDATIDVKEVLFSDGKWERKVVPFLDGKSNPSVGWYYLLSAGFDGDWIKKILFQEEPDRVGLLIPIPGVNPAYEQRCLDGIKSITSEFMIPEEYHLRAHAADAVAAWQKVSASGQERWEDEQVAYLCCGTKPHAVAMALRALVHRYPAVLYFLPERYKVIPVEEAGTFWRYTIVDHSSFVPRRV
jgi:hypothetical protein